jgi:hypothetical protein
MGRGRRRVDFGRLREASAGPGADPRVWIALGRIDDDEDAVRWEDELGWVVDVTFSGGGLDQEGPVACRVTSAFGGDGLGRSEPPARGVVVVVAIPEGDPNTEPTVLGYLAGPGCAPPSAVNGDDITETKALGTHLLVSDAAVDWQVEDGIRFKATGSSAKARLLAPAVELATQGAGQAFVRGNAQKDALVTFLTALGTWASSVETTMTNAPFPKPGLAASLAALQTAITQLKTDLASALSTKIKGE